ncbi:MAG: HAMP domain-containing sensor histidine kinase [Sulfurimonas sp.]
MKTDETIIEERVDLLIRETMKNIAHQWRQPLAQINATVTTIDNILYEKNIEDHRLEKKLSEIEKLTKYMSNTIEDFREGFANKEKKNSLKLDLLLQEAIEVVYQSFEDNSVELIQNFDVDCKYECCENKLKQIIVVLLNNAKDALLIRNTFGAKVVIGLEQIDNKYIITVQDNAGGITKSVMAKIFEPHYTTKHSSEGTGIGLYMAKKIIEENYKGSLSVKNLGEGSCFTIVLPIEG